MKEIALEFSINWDSKAFEQRMSKPPAFIQVCPTVCCNNTGIRYNTKYWDVKSLVNFLVEQKYSSFKF